MAMILSIETATQVCSVALTKGKKTIAIEETNIENSHSSKLTIFIQELCKRANVKLEEVDVVAVSSGPGSYTGLRIGVSVAKGLCFSLEKPLISVETLHAMALNFVMQKEEELSPNILLCPMIDARRMEVYSALFSPSNKRITKTDAIIIDENSFSTYFDKKLLIFGDGAEKSKNVIPHAEYIPNVYPTAKTIGIIAEEKFEKQDFEDIAYFEPFYLKDFIAAKPKVKGF
jgi:tRNA threonylcarbamoyladenosine biosynthesis protein TsaB